MSNKLPSKRFLKTEVCNLQLLPGKQIPLSFRTSPSAKAVSLTTPPAISTAPLRR